MKKSLEVDDGSKIRCTKKLWDGGRKNCKPVMGGKCEQRTRSHPSPRYQNNGPPLGGVYVLYGLEFKIIYGVMCWSGSSSLLYRVMCLLGLLTILPLPYIWTQFQILILLICFLYIYRWLNIQMHCDMTIVELFLISQGLVNKGNILCRAVASLLKVILKGFQYVSIGTLGDVGWLWCK